jgi:hypothetical protein
MKYQITFDASLSKPTCKQMMQRARNVRMCQKLADSKQISYVDIIKMWNICWRLEQTYDFVAIPKEK